MNLPGLNFQLGEDIDALRDTVRAFAAAEIAPRAVSKSGRAWRTTSQKAALWFISRRCASSCVTT